MIILNENSKQIFDVVIVLGAAVLEGGKPSKALKRRVFHAVNLIKQERANYLLLTGGVGKYPPSEAGVMKDLAIAEGLPENIIFIEKYGISTFSSIMRCIKIIVEQKWSDVIVVSDTYHIIRAIFVLRCFKVKAVGSGAKGGRKENKLWKWYYYLFREFFALLWYIFLVLYEKYYQKTTRS